MGANPLVITPVGAQLDQVLRAAGKLFGFSAPNLVQQSIGVRDTLVHGHLSHLVVGQWLRCCQGKFAKLKRPLPRPQSGNGDRPRGRRVGAETPKGGSADQMALDVEGVVNRRVGGEESLG